MFSNVFATHINFILSFIAVGNKRLSVILYLLWPTLSSGCLMKNIVGKED